MNVPYSIHRFGQTARDMNTQQYIDWDQRRQSSCRSADEKDADSMLSDALFANDRGYSIAKMVTYRVYIQHSLHKSQKEHSVY